MKKIFFFRLIAGAVLLFLAAPFAWPGGGQPEGGGAKSGSPRAAVNVTYPITTEGVKKLTFWLPIQPPAAKHMSSYNDHPIFKIISQNTGVEVEFFHPAVGQEREQLGILVASGDLPDLVQIRGLYNGGSGAGVAEGIFRDLTGDIPVYAPDYYREITRTESNYRRATNNEGKLTAFLEIKQSAPPFYRVNYRQDVMDQLGLDNPATIADYNADFAKMKAAGITAFAPPANGRISLFMWPYGVTPGFFVGADGKIKWGEAEAGYKQYLQLMNDWYTKGYIYPDFMSNMTDTERRALIANKSVAMIVESVDLVKSVTDSASLKSVPMPYPRLTPGQPIHFDTVSFTTQPNAAVMDTVVTTACKNPEIAMEYMNYFFTQAGADLCNWGVKDGTYTVDAAGKKTFTDTMLRNPTIPLGDIQTVLKIHLFAKLAEPDVVCNPNVIINPEALELRMRYSDDKTIDNSQTLPPIQLSIDDSQARNQIMRDINTYVDEMSLKFITSVTPLSEFDNYVAQIKKMNLDEAIKITERGYQEYMKKPGIPGK